MKRRLINAGIWTAKQLWLPSITNWEMAGLFAVLLAKESGVSGYACLGAFIAWWFAGRVLRPTAEALEPIGKWSDHFPAIDEGKATVWVSYRMTNGFTWTQPAKVVRTDKEADQ